MKKLLTILILPVIVALVSAAPGQKTSTTTGAKRVAAPKSATNENVDGNGNYILKWTEVAPEDGSFKVTFLGKPVKTVKSVDPGFGQTDQVTYESITPYGIYSINYLDFPFPSPITEEKKLRTIYDAVEASSVSRGNTLTDSKDVTVDGYLGRESVIKLPDSGGTGSIITLRVILAGKRCFQLSAIRTISSALDTPAKKERDQKHLKAFLDSFKLKTPAAASKP